MPNYKESNNGIYIPDSVKRKDFMTTEKSGSSKGKAGSDPLKSQYQYNEILKQREIDNIYRNKRIAQNIIDIPAEDATREWIEFEDTSEAEDLIDKLNELNAQPAFQKMIEYERLTGDGFISLGCEQASSFEIDEPIEEGTLRDIEYLHPFSRKRMLDALLDDDPFSKTFNKFQYYELEPLDFQVGSRLVHSSRILHLQTRVFEGDEWGSPLMQALYEPITILDSFAWSLGQIAYAMTFKVFKSDNINMGNRQEAKNIANELESFFNTMSLAVIGNDEELTHEGPSGSLPNLKAMAEFIWDFLAGAARMPKSHMLGQQQGTVTGGEYDSLNYYMRISGIQENYLRPLLERLIDLLYKSSNSGVGSGSVEEPDYTLKFKPLWKLDKKTDAEIRELYSKIDKKYYEMNALSSDEIREKRFGSEGFMDEMEVDLNDEQIKELANEVHKAEQEAKENGQATR